MTSETGSLNAVSALSPRDDKGGDDDGVPGADDCGHREILETPADHSGTDSSEDERPSRNTSKEIISP
jgi:hypothetical protein